MIRSNMEIGTLKKRHRKKSAVRCLALAFTFGFLFGAMASVLELRWLPISAPKIKNCILKVSHSFHSQLMSTIAKLHVRAQMWTSRLQQRARILCWIMTTLDNHQSKAFHVKTTWGKHCDILIFMSDGSDENLPAVDLKVGKGRQYLWAKTVGAFLYVHAHFKNEYDWVIKADDDTFMLIENARKMLLPYSPNEKIFFGYNLKLDNNDTAEGSYPSGGAGYILSKSSVEIFVEAQLNRDSVDEESCLNSTDDGAEDFNLGYCLGSLNVAPVDTRDQKGRNVFSPLHFRLTIFPTSSNLSTNWWLFEDPYWPVTKSGHDTFTAQYVSTHYMNATLMYNINYLLYSVKNVVPVENFPRMKQNATLFEQYSLPKVNYSGIK